MTSLSNIPYLIEILQANNFSLGEELEQIKADLQNKLEENTQKFIKENKKTENKEKTEILKLNKTETNKLDLKK